MTGTKCRIARRGAIAPLTALLLVPLVGMLAGLVPPARPALARHITYAATLHPVKVEPEAGVAVSVTAVPLP